MWLKGDISIILEFAKKDWDAVPFGVAFGNTFVGVVIFKKRDAEQRRGADAGDTQATCLRDDEHEAMRNFGVSECPECGKSLS